MADPILQPEEHANEQRATASPTESIRPFDVVKLPTLGKLYTDGPLAGVEYVEVHYLTAKEEDILTSTNLIQSGKMIDALLRSVLRDRTIDPQKMFLGDRNTILVWLRSTGYGAEYEVELQCGACGDRFAHTFDLSALDVRELDITPDEDGLFSLDLPVTKETVRLRFLTAEEDAEIDKQVALRTRKLGGGGNPMTARLLAYVKDVVGKDDNERKAFIESLPVRDTRAIRKFIADYEPSVVMQQDAQCTKCGHLNEEVGVPVTAQFFWPDA